MLPAAKGVKGPGRVFPVGMPYQSKSKPEGGKEEAVTQTSRLRLHSAHSIPTTQSCQGAVTLP